MLSVCALRAFACSKAGVACVLVVLAGSTTPAHGYLGSFEPADGYQGFLNHVHAYNAGQYGPNSGYMAMAPNPLPLNTGLWSALSGGSGLAYATGHFAFDRQWVNNGLGSSADQGLVITTHDQGWNGPAQRYKYNVDSQDLNGVPPPMTAGTKVQVSFWVKGTLPTDPAGVNGVPNGYFGNSVEFADSSGNIGFRLGLTAQSGGNMVTCWDGSTMAQSPLIHFGSRYDRWDVTLDLATQTVSADYYNFILNTTTNLVNGAPLMAGMGDFSSMFFQSSPGVTNGKYWAVDDFAFRAVPGPGAAGVLGLGALAVARRRRR